MSDLDMESDAKRVAVQEPAPLTTADVKRRYSWGMAPHKSIPGGMYTVASAAADFDRWLTAHDAEVRADERAKRPDREQIKEALAKVLDGQEAMHCTRVWEAWSYNTMTADDFSLVAEDDAALEELADAVLSSLALEPEAREDLKLSGILARAEEVRQDDGWGIGGAWGDYGEVVVPIRILSYVIEGELDQKVASTDPGFAMTYAEQVRRAEIAEAKLAEAREEHRPVDIEPSDTVCAKCSRRQGDGTYAETVEWPCALAEASEEAEYFRDGDGDLWKFTDKGEWFHEEEPGEFRQVLSIDAEDQTLTPVGHAELAPAPEVTDADASPE